MFKDLSEFILNNLQAKVIEQGLNNYQTFGKNVEDPVSDLIEEYFKKNNYNYTATRAPDKNTFPDLKITLNNQSYAFEHKAGASDKPPANDLGTLLSLPEKLKDYKDNIYYTFVKYSKATQDNGIIIEAVYFDKIYKFIGKRDEDLQLLKYREKDGNLRPKSWNDFSNGTSYFNSFDEFKIAIQRTNTYRSERIISKHLDNLDLAGLEQIQLILTSKINNYKIESNIDTQD